ncbi:flagellar motor switch phosphatase FliY [Bacillus sp. Marseille-P3661]|uniref:flagellar motor switch phosphatase FliY n=1 Tax=Bacillus sp. Marseille-P3661 TaxID=1936234 RepID=UPI000C863933|nr:flagellar motor switch phosphatase FliY [Bacillus sp. Marseille-P3661]
MVSDDMLSQDEIDALLRGSDDSSDFGNSGLNVDLPLVEDYLSSMEQDALGEVGNISFGSSATALSTLLNQKVEITTPTVSVVQRNHLADAFPQPYVAVQVRYTEGFRGYNVLVIRQRDASIIADLMLGGDGTNPTEDLDEIHLSAVQEAMNQMMGSAATSMSTIFSKKIDISPPSIDVLDFIQGAGTDRIPEDEVLVQISFNLKIGNLIDSNIMQLLQIDFAKEMVENLLNPQPDFGPELTEGTNHDSQSPFNHANTRPTPSEPAMQQQVQPMDNQPNNTSMPNYQQMGNFAQPQIPVMPTFNGPQHIGAGQANPANVQPAVFSSFEQPHALPQEVGNLNMLLDIPLQVTVELGRTKRSVQQILELSSGSIIELDKLAGEPVDILVNNKLIAKGEVVVIEENFGVRVTDIISQTDRIRKLQ